jgi:hypothetical protein
MTLFFVLNTEEDTRGYFVENITVPIQGWRSVFLSFTLLISWWVFMQNERSIG